MQQNPQPPTILNRLKQIQGELAALVSALDRPAPSVPDERGQRGQAGSRPALLQNPFVGYIDNVTPRAGAQGWHGERVQLSHGRGQIRDLQ
jgi:hypothetical protein